MTTDNAMVLVLLSLLAIAHCADVQSTTNGDENENRVEPSGQPQTAAVGDGRPEGHGDESTAVRSGRQFYQTYQQPPFAQRRAYKGPGRKKKRPTRTKSVRRPRPRRRPGAGPAMRYKRLPPPPPLPPRAQQQLQQQQQQQQQQHVNSNYVDYDDESQQQSVSSFDYGEREFDRHAAYLYGTTGPMTAAAVPAVAVVHELPGRARKRRPYAADEPPRHQTVAVLPVVRATRPVVATPTVAATDTMEKLKQMVHEAMDEHFATRHQELYADGFEKQRPHHQNQVYSAKYKQQPDKQQRTSSTSSSSSVVDANRPSALPLTSTPSKNRDPSSSSSSSSDADADADGSDDRLTLAEISAYMGAKPVETVLTAGGHRYVLSDAIQQSHRRQQQQQKRYAAGDDEDDRQQHGQRQYLRYVSPFDALYELPAARWTYK